MSAKAGVALKDSHPEILTAFLDGDRKFELSIKERLAISATDLPKSVPRRSYLSSGAVAVRQAKF